MSSMLQRLDPRRSLAAAVAWEVGAITLLAATLASAWFATVARFEAQQTIGATYRQYATQISNEIDINLYARLQYLQSVRAATSFFSEVGIGEAAQRAGRLFPKIRAELPEIEWVAFAGPEGRVLAASGAGMLPGADVSRQPWFDHGRRSAWVGDVHDDVAIAALLAGGDPGNTARLAELSVPVLDARGKLLGVIGANLGLAWIRMLESNITSSLRTPLSVEVLLVARDGLVLFGPQNLVGHHVQGEAQAASARALAVVTASLAQQKVPPPDQTSGQLVAAWAGGEEYLVGFAVSDGAAGFPGGTGWTVWVRVPAETAYGPIRQQWRQNLATIALLGLLIIAGGILLARRLTRRLSNIASSADDIREGRRRTLEVPQGADEVARIGLSLQKLLDDLATRNRALAELNAELDARVAARTRDVERLAEDNRRAAMVRERLRFARDLHDTLAHSIMELLTQIRLMRKLADSEPARLAQELERAEEAAHAGLRHARRAISELRQDVVRDLGLGAALRNLLARVGERHGIAIDYAADAGCEAMADVRAETLYRIADEALGNVERHARAGTIKVSLGYASADKSGTKNIVLEVQDDGAGFDTDAVPRVGHYGLRGMRELAELVGASLSLESRPGHGTRITVTLPSLDGNSGRSPVSKT